MQLEAEIFFPHINPTDYTDSNSEHILRLMSLLSASSLAGLLRIGCEKSKRLLMGSFALLPSSSTVSTLESPIKTHLGHWTNLMSVAFKCFFLGCVSRWTHRMGVMSIWCVMLASLWFFPTTSTSVVTFLAAYQVEQFFQP